MSELIIENAFLNDINPLLCGTEACKPGHSFGPATREYYLLHYVVKGKGTFNTPENSYTITKGQIFVIRPGIRTTYTASSEQPWEYIWVGFEANKDIGERFTSDVVNAPFCKNLFESMLECDTVGLKSYYLAGRIFELVRHMDEQENKQSTTTEQYVNAAVSHIKANYQAEITVGSIAAGLNLERSYFWKIFKQHTGKSPQQYIVEYRMNKAASLLQNRGYTPGETAKEVGYPDVLSFSRMFKRFYGVSPSGYIEMKK